jgi:hypothetical protein
VLGAEVGAVYRDLHLDHGVQMLLGTGVEAFEGGTAVERVRASDGRELACDFVVVGVGVAPRTGLAAPAGLAVDNGILVDEHLQTSAPGVFAAGDVANAHHPFYGVPIRVEHWANALHQGPVAARTMLGQSAVYDRVPYFFSDQYDVGMEYAGFARTWDRVIFSRRSRDPRVHRLLACRGSRRGPHQRQRVGRHRLDPAPHPRARGRRRPAPRGPRRPARRPRPRRRRPRGMNRLGQLHDAGVSIWLDTLSRELLDSGAFTALIADCAVTGATSNPTIFAKAITGSDSCDDQLRAAVASGVRDPQELFFELALDDVRHAADVLRPTYEASDGRDGFVSFECTPDLADDTAATIEQAVGLWGRLARPNVIIKVP